MDKHFIIDIETAPLDYEAYEKIPEEDKMNQINPIDARIVAIGLRYRGENRIFMGQDEKQILSDFWNEWAKIKKAEGFVQIVGFNVAHFDLPFLVARSLINNVIIEPFVLKQVVDLRDKINAYRYGKTRGKLKEYAALIGLEILETDGSMVPKLWHESRLEEIKKYLEKDLEITASLYKRAKETRVLEIEKW